MSYTIFDLETTTKESFKRKANPFDPDNHVVASGRQRKDGQIEGEYYGRVRPTGDWFTKLLKGTTLLVGQNLKFDILYAIREQENFDAWMDWVAAGGRIWCTQIAEFLLDGMAQESQMLSMDEMAVRYGGSLKIDEVKAMWNAGIDTVDIPEQLLMDYLLGRNTPTGFEEGDIGNTRIIFLGQLERAQKAGQMKSIMLNMGSLICSIEMEKNGMAIDQELGGRLAEKLGEELASKLVELNGYLPADLPFEFNWGSPAQKSALIFGGDVKYQQRVPILDEQGKQVYAQKKETHYVLTDSSTMGVDEWHERYPAGGVPDVYRFAGGKNKGEPKTKQVTVPDLSKPKSRLEDTLYRFPRITEPKRAWAGSDETQWSTGAEVIKELGQRNIPFLKLMAEVTGMTKDLSTYYITTDDKGKQKGMLTLVQPDGVIHHKINHTAVITARFSSSDPNLQNIPKGDKSDVKTVFVSRFGEYVLVDPDLGTMQFRRTGKICQSDFKSLEIYIQAILTQCRQLIEDLKAGLDMHVVRLAQKEHLEYEEVLALVASGDATWKKKRTGSKNYSFQRAYGAGVAKIAGTTGLTEEEVQQLVDADNLRYPEIEPWYEKLTETIKKNRRPTSTIVPHPELRGVMCQLGKSWYRTPDGKLYTYREQPSPEYVAKRGTFASFSPTEIKNYVVQGEGGEWAKAAMLLAVRAFYARRNFGGKALLVNQVHDALYGDFDHTVAAEAACLLHACMEGASDYMEWYFNWEVPVPVPSETKLGASMAEEHDLPDGWQARAAHYRQEIRTNYMNNYIPSFDRNLQ